MIFPLPKMLDIFQNAAMLVGAHGAGLANMIWAPPGVCIVEVLCRLGFGPKFIFNDMAMVSGHHYHGMLATSRSMSNMHVDLREVERIVRKMLDLKVTHPQNGL